jgi:hypothetical protein
MQAAAAAVATSASNIPTVTFESFFMRPPEFHRDDSIESTGMSLLAPAQFNQFRPKSLRFLHPRRSFAPQAT